MQFGSGTAVAWELPYATGAALKRKTEIIIKLTTIYNMKEIKIRFFKKKKKKINKMYKPLQREERENINYQHQE